MTKLQIFDSTLRDGAQGANISFSVDDKIKVIETLDRLGVDFIEAGNPFSNPAEMQFFQRIRGMKLEHANLVAFGSTPPQGHFRRRGQQSEIAAGGKHRVRCHFRKEPHPPRDGRHQGDGEENLAMIGGA